MNDPIVDEVRKARAEHASRFDNDLKRIVADLQSRQMRHGSRLVSLPSKKISTKDLLQTIR
jgi:hypothetical protein